MPDEDGSQQNTQALVSITQSDDYYLKVEALSGVGMRGQYLVDLDVQDTVPPRITSIAGIPAEGGSIGLVTNPITVNFSEDLDISSRRSWTSAVLRQYGGHTYVLAPSQMTWPDAESYAQSLGGHLVTINDAAENEWIRQTFTAAWGSTWIGLNDVTTEGTFVWTSGEAVSYTNWASGQPNNSSNSDAVYIYEGGLWDDTTTSSALYAVVELDGTLADSDGDGWPDITDPYVNDAFNGFDLRAAGADAAFDTGDDVVYTLSRSTSAGRTACRCWTGRRSRGRIA